MPALGRRLGPLARRLFFEALYACRRDPFGYEVYHAEQQKYVRVLAVLEGRRFERALEIGCSIGVFTEMLSPFCRELLAIDTSSRAVARARRRLARRPQVRVERWTLPEAMPAGTFDLIVCGEVLYYWERATVIAALPLLAGRLRPSGWLISTNWRGKGASSALAGHEVRALLLHHLPLTHSVSEAHDGYFLDRFDKPPATAAAST